MTPTPPPLTAHDDGSDEDDFQAPPPGAGVPNPKLQRWVDLIAALLARKSAITFEELIPNVSEYAVHWGEAQREPDARGRKTKVDSLKRTFERDKDELRAFGIPIESLEDAEENPGGAYRLKRSDFYLPYLSLAVPGQKLTSPRRLDRFGYQALASLTFEADELQAVVDAAAGVRGLGDPLLTHDVDHALRKLAVDLPVDSALPSADEPRIVLTRSRPDAATFEALGDALRRRKHATFTYHAMSSDRTEAREVEPYGLFFVSAHWYLAGRDRERGELRNFRLSRMSKVKVNAARAQSPDYEVAPDFRLREHARSRQAWELGDAEPMSAVVAFEGSSGPTMAASRLGRAVDGEPLHRVFEVQRPDAFVRWLLSFAGEVVPVGPDEIVVAYHQLREATSQVYAGDASHAPDAEDATAARDGEPAGARSSAPPLVDHTTAAAATARTAAGQPWQPKGAAAQLRRILQVVPQIADGEEHSLEAIAARVGTTVEVLQRDLYSLVARYDSPGGFVEGVQLFVEPDRVSARSNHLLRPMRLTVSELCALELGLAVLRATRPPDEHAVLDRARERLRAVIAKLPGDPIPSGVHGVSFGDEGNTEHLAQVRTALREHRKLRLTYRKSGCATPGERTVCPYALLVANG
ncbi:MAG: WYL domain-containing protein, partial [Gemmatimonadota bacterium]